MNKNVLKWIAILTVTLIFIYAFSNSYESRNIDNIAYVIAIGADLADDDKNLKVTFQFTDITAFSNDNSGEESSPILDTVVAPSIDSAINLMNVYLSKEINLSHCKAITFSKELATRGIFNVVSELINNPQVRPTANIIISKEDANRYLKRSISSLENLLTKYYDIFPNSGDYTGYTTSVTLGKFYNSLIEKVSGNTSILGGENTDSTGAISPSEITAGNSPIDGERNTENIGLAVFRNDEYVGNLTALETLYHSLIDNKVNSFLLTVDAPNNINQKLDIHLSQVMPSDVKVDISNDVPIININIYVNGKIFTIIKDLNYSDDKLLENISNSVSENLEKNILNYLNKTTSTFKCDIDCFYKSAKQNFLTLDEWNKYDWISKYQNAKFNVNVNASVVSSFLVSEN